MRKWFLTKTLRLRRRIALWLLAGASMEDKHPNMMLNSHLEGETICLNGFHVRFCRFYRCRLEFWAAGADAKLDQSIFIEC